MFLARPMLAPARIWPPSRAACCGLTCGPGALADRAPMILPGSVLVPIIDPGRRPPRIQPGALGPPIIHRYPARPIIRPQLEHHLHCPFPQLSGMRLPGYREPQLSRRSRPPRNPGPSRSRSRTGTLPGRMRRARRPGSRSGQAPVVQVLPARLSMPGVQWRRRMGSIGRRAARAGLLSLASGLAVAARRGPVPGLPHAETSTTEHAAAATPHRPRTARRLALGPHEARDACRGPAHSAAASPDGLLK